MPWWMAALNMMMALGSLVFALVALVRPAALSGGEATAATRYYAAMYASRAVPLALATGWVIVGAFPPAAIIVILIVAALAQVGDIAIGARRHVFGMVCGGAVALAVHGGTAVFLAAGL